MIFSGIKSCKIGTPGLMLVAIGMEQKCNDRLDSTTFGGLT